MTSCHGNALLAFSTFHRWNPSYKASNTELYVFLRVSLDKLLNSRVPGDLEPSGAHVVLRQSGTLPPTLFPPHSPTRFVLCCCCFCAVAFVSTLYRHRLGRLLWYRGNHKTVCSTAIRDERYLQSQQNHATVKLCGLQFTFDEHLLTWIDFNLGMNKYLHALHGVKLFIHSHTTTVQPLNFGNGYISSSHFLMGMWLLIHTAIKVNPY